MTYLGLGQNLIWVSLGLAIVCVALAGAGLALRDRRWVAGARNAMIAGGMVTAGAAASLVAGFFRGAYDVEYVYHYSERNLSAAKKFAGLWAGLDGSILFWAAILGLVGSVLAAGFLRATVDAERRRLEPWVYIVFSLVQCFFLYVSANVQRPFKPIEPHELAMLTEGGLARQGMPTDGRGLNPLLDTYWMMIHPPSVYLGFILYTVPFAYGAAALLAGEFSTAWIKATRGWTMVAWIFNTNGIVLGGLWAYEVLGWGGYWAWDPVENASFLPWLTGTAFLHSVMVQERRDMLRVWNALLVCLTFLLSIFGTYLTRSGIVSSVHAFANGGVGEWFLGFIVVIVAFTVFALAFRAKGLRAERTIDDPLSRESVFILNNFVLLALAVAITILTLWPKITFEFVRRSISVGVPVFNRVCVPLFALLLLLTAIGPMLAWVKTSRDRVARNLLGPAIAALILAATQQWYVWTYVRGGDLGEVFPAADHVWPTFFLLFIAWLILTSLAWELIRTVLNSARGSGRDALSVFVKLVTFQNRRYGGYLVHAGLAVLAMGVTLSSMYKVETEVNAGREETARVGPYDIRIAKLDARGVEPLKPYESYTVPVTVLRGETELASVAPSLRHYPKTGHRREAQPVTQVEIARLANEDVYFSLERGGETGWVFRIYRNPCMWLVWAGWLTMIAGGAFAALPLGGRRVGLA